MGSSEPTCTRTARGTGHPPRQRGSSCESADQRPGRRGSTSDPLLATPVSHIRRRLMLRAFPPKTYCESR
jgi:hypothetical protein